MAVFAIGRMKAGIRSRRAAASGLHRTRAGAAASGVASIAANGQPGPPGAAASGSAASRSAPPMSGAWAIDARRCSNGWAGSVRPPTLTPRLLTIWVSNWFVSIATRKPHSGQRKVTASEPSSGPSVARSFIGSSQSRQRNFMAAPFYHRCREPAAPARGAAYARGRAASGPRTLDRARSRQRVSPYTREALATGDSGAPSNRQRAGVTPRRCRHVAWARPAGGGDVSVYDEVFARSMRDPEGFWGAAAE